jgi:hypothetical protein
LTPTLPSAIKRLTKLLTISVSARLMPDANTKRPPGRPPAPPEQRLEVVTLRVTASQKAKLAALGGGEWMRKAIDRAKVKA